MLVMLTTQIEHSDLSFISWILQKLGEMSCSRPEVENITELAFNILQVRLMLHVYG